MIVIGLAGVARSGKNTVATMIENYCDEHNLVHTSHAFADPVKLMVERLDPYVRIDGIRFVRVSELLEECDTSLTWHEKWDQIKSHNNVRALLQRMGTDAGRVTLGEEVWVDVMEYKIEEAKHEGIDVFIIPDVRFPEEQSLVYNSRTGTVVHVMRNVDDLLGENATHISETSIDRGLVDYDLMNDGTLDELNEQVLELMESLLRSKGAQAELA